MKKILITGSHGFIARNTALLLKKKSYKVHGIGNGKWNKIKAELSSSNDSEKIKIEKIVKPLEGLFVLQVHDNTKL